MINPKIGYIICEDFTEPSPVELQPKLFNGKIVGEGILQRANEKNRNGRFYAREELFPQLTAPRTMELLNAGYLRAESSHPLSKDLQRQSAILDERCCARFLKIWTEGDLIKAHFCATNNDFGRAFNADLQEGCKPAWSLRALGSVHQTARGAEVRDIRVITWDNVIFPSHPGAYTTSLVYESATESGIITPKAPIRGIEESTMEASATPITNDKIISYIQSESANFKFIRECFDFMYNSIEINEAGTKVLLTTAQGETLVVNIESYIHNELMNYAATANKYVD